MRLLPLALLLLAAAPPNAPWNDAAPNSPEHVPAFPGQTRAPAVHSASALSVATVASGLDHPWGLAFLPDGRMLVTERDKGAMRIVSPGGRLSPPLAGLPRTDIGEQGGMLDVALSPDFARSGRVYFTYSEPRAGGNGTAVAYGTLVDGSQPRLGNIRVIARQLPTLRSHAHFGGRILFAPDGTLFTTFGERFILPGRYQAERTDGTLGKIVHVNPDGTPAANNPLLHQPGKRPELWSWGHRNPQGLAFDARGRLWEAEFGPLGGDEINLIMPGRDYGWPTITYGREYSGKPVGRDITAAPGLEQPVYYWDPVISPSGLAIYRGKLFPEWRGDFFLVGLSSQALVRIVMRNDRVVGEERLLTNLEERFRHVIEGPDGALYVLTDSDQGRILRVTPK